MTIPSYEELMPTVLRYSTNERLVRDAVAHISEELKLTADELAETIPSGTEKLISSRVQWALSYLVQAGLIKRPKRAHFIITESGRDVLANDIEKLDSKYLRTIPAFQDFLSRKGTRKSLDKTQASTPLVENYSNENPEELIGQAYEEIESVLSEQILERILQNSPAFFEHLVVKLLSSMGYGKPDTFAEVMGKVGDGGIDGIIHQDKLGLDVVYIQAKRYAPENTVSRPELQAFVGTLAGVSAHKGVFVTTSRFSSGALEYLKTVNARVITIDGQKLADLMIEHEVGVRIKRTLEIHRVDEDFFLED